MHTGPGGAGTFTVLAGRSSSRTAALGVRSGVFVSLRALSVLDSRADVQRSCSGPPVGGLRAPAHPVGSAEVFVLRGARVAHRPGSPL